MSLPAESKLPVPKGWEEFQDIMLDLLKVKGWTDIHPNGRAGQNQQGVDIYGKSKGVLEGVQCKNVKSLTIKDIETEYNKAEKFKPPLNHLIIATTLPEDAKLQEKVRNLSQKLEKKKKFSLEIRFWNELCLEVTSYPALVEKYYPPPFSLSADILRMAGGGILTLICVGLILIFGDKKWETINSELASTVFSKVFLGIPLVLFLLYVAVLIVRAGAERKSDVFSKLVCRWRINDLFFDIWTAITLTLITMDGLIVGGVWIWVQLKVPPRYFQWYVIPSLLAGCAVAYYRLKPWIENVYILERKGA